MMSGADIFVCLFRDTYHQKRTPQEVCADNWIGMVCQQTSPAAIAEAAIEDAKFVCTRQYGDAPDVTLHGRLDLTFSCECLSLDDDFFFETRITRPFPVSFDIC